MTFARLLIRFLLVVAALFVLGCGVLVWVFWPGQSDVRSDPFPWAGWQGMSSFVDSEVSPEIARDYHAYIDSLPPEEQQTLQVSRHDILLSKDGAGQHAVILKVPLRGTWWDHVLIYDKSHKRVQTIKYVWGHYSC